MAGDSVRINGFIHSWGSIKVKIADEQYVGFTGLGFGDKLERVFAYGMGPHHAPRAQSRGKYSTEPVKLKGPPGSIQTLRSVLAAKSASGTSYGSVEFEVIAQFFTTGDVPITVQLESCLWAENASQHDESPDPLSEEITFTTMKVRRNGLVLFDDSEGSP
jgi:hypothetical protein